MNIKVKVELSKDDRRTLARWRNERYGEHERIASKKQCKDMILHAVRAFLDNAGEAARSDERIGDSSEEGGD